MVIIPYLLYCDYWFDFCVQIRNLYSRNILQSWWKNDRKLYYSFLTISFDVNNLTSRSYGNFLEFRATPSGRKCGWIIIKYNSEIEFIDVEKYYRPVLQWKIIIMSFILIEKNFLSFYIHALRITWAVGWGIFILVYRLVMIYLLY